MNSFEQLADTPEIRTSIRFNLRHVMQNTPQLELQVLARARREYDPASSPELTAALQAMLGGDIVTCRVSYLSGGFVTYNANLLPNGAFDPYAIQTDSELQRNIDVGEARVGVAPEIAVITDLAERFAARLSPLIH